jgi:hypothetical protein
MPTLVKEKNGLENHQKHVVVGVRGFIGFRQ